MVGTIGSLQHLGHPTKQQNHMFAEVVMDVMINFFYDCNLLEENEKSIK